jgi:serine/threonine protein phosphatase PrpC
MGALSNPSSAGAPLIDWGAASRALPGETETGDAYLVQPFDGGVLVAVADGLGNGREAAEAAGIAMGLLRDQAGKDLVRLVRLCHERLHGTRGVVMSLACFDAGEPTMTWLGVGNVEGHLLRADPSAKPPRDSIMLRGGVLGFRAPEVRASRRAVSAGDLVILATDGIRGGFWGGVDLDAGLQKIADDLLRQYGKASDDALAVAVRYLGVG